MYGYVLASSQAFRLTVQCQRRVTLALAVASTVTMFAFDWMDPGYHYVPYTLDYVPHMGMRALNVWLWLMTFLGYSGTYLNVDSRFLRYSRDAAYPFHILHQTVVIIVGSIVIQSSMNPLVKMLLIAAISFPIILLLYDLVIRRTNLFRILFGMKRKGRVADASALREAAQPVA